MKVFFSLALVPLLLFTAGCSTRVSSTHDYSYGHHHGQHNHVSISGHGRSGAAVLGALIVGGIINSIIHQSQHHDSEEEYVEEALAGGSGNQELVSGYDIPEPNQKAVERESQLSTDNGLEEYQARRSEQTKVVEWYQLGKDQNCYLMRIENGVNDVVSAVPANKCSQ